MDYIDEKTKQFLDNLAEGKSNEELFKAPEVKPIQRDLTSEAIIAFAPALLGSLTGEAGALAAPEAQKQARTSYDAQRKEAQDMATKNAELQQKAKEKMAEQAYKVDKEIADRNFRTEQLKQKTSSDEENRELRRLQIEATRAAAQDRIAAAAEAKAAKAEEKNRPSDKQVEALNDIDTAVSDINNILALKTGSKIDSGPLAGRVPDVLSSDEVNAFRSALGRYKDQYRKAITGAGAGPTEIAMLEQRLPSEKDNDKTFKAKADEAIKELARRKTVYLSNLSKQGRNVEKFKSEEDSKSSGDEGKKTASNYTEKLEKAFAAGLITKEQYEASKGK